ncbi:MAG: hypothetical protein ACD_18C00064G0005 [uncultured bacterium]|nr:MAG: hypothetical protein ACD_18C00064G0005 [uncultured bacterium]OGH83601.1 MAG: hypothetical protein A2488_03515 [Candidatus Magasanikbacteria bacterium RIFOXYC12_FULL_32_21b]OGH90657.1 MAG: hypothetical protein A2507_01850 [Candidatus Magasanikbacteria bacterium RIFOXYD12_FULL_33_17]HAO52311.1 hypothetical protein [Candidatus Magasanikbacteria bacterium]
MKYLAFSFVMFFSFFVFVPQALAVNLGGNILNDAGKKAGYDPGTTNTTLAKNIGIVVNILLSVVGLVFTILMIYAGYTWMIARGDDGKVDKAKSIIKASIIGLIITLAAYSISNFVVSRVLAQTLALLDNYNLFV